VQESIRLLKLVNSAVETGLGSESGPQLAQTMTQHNLPSNVAKLIVWVQQQPQLATTQQASGNLNLHAQLWRSAMKCADSVMKPAAVCSDDDSLPLLVKQVVTAFDAEGEPAV
jgi:hypothetical protein